MGSNPASRANRLLRQVAIPIQIVGAGIAGLACAIACRQLGLPVGISERADEPRPEGAGIQLSPNAVRALHTLGLTPALRLHATEPTAIRLRSLASGASIACLAAGAYFEKKYGQPTLTIHRAALQAALLARAQALGISVRWGEGWSVDGLEGARATLGHHWGRWAMERGATTRSRGTGAQANRPGRHSGALAHLPEPTLGDGQGDHGLVRSWCPPRGLPAQQTRVLWVCVDSSATAHHGVRLVKSCLEGLPWARLGGLLPDDEGLPWFS